MPSKRLCTIASMVKGDVIYDVGADHGELELILSRDEKIKKIYAIENKIGPFEALNKIIHKYRLDKVTSFLGDGLSQISIDVNVVVIAGMGGQLIKKILSNGNLDNVNQIIISPHKNKEVVVEYILSIGYKLENQIEEIDKNKKYYHYSFIR